MFLLSVKLQAARLSMSNGPVAFRPRITPGLAKEAARLSIIYYGPVAFRPMIAHGLAGIYLKSLISFRTVPKESFMLMVDRPSFTQ